MFSTWYIIVKKQFILLIKSSEIKKIVPLVIKRVPYMVNIASQTMCPIDISGTVVGESPDCLLLSWTVVH